MVTDWAQLHEWSQLIRAEYEELPDLQLTQSQVEELWGLDTVVADALLRALVSAGILKKTHQGAYVRAEAR
jgi:hypothetical protein